MCLLFMFTVQLFIVTNIYNMPTNSRGLIRQAIGKEGPGISPQVSGSATITEATVAEQSRILYWKKSLLTYGFVNFSPDLSRDEIREAIRQAFNTWMEVVPLHFQEVHNHTVADIKIGFFYGSHEDPTTPEMFDGPGGILAHSYYPPYSNLHFDEAEWWTHGKDNLGNNTDLYTNALHEIGHTLGKNHSANPNTIMAAKYIPPYDEYGKYVRPRLKTEDIIAMQAIYGVRKKIGQKNVIMVSDGTVPPVSNGTMTIISNEIVLPVSNGTRLRQDVQKETNRAHRRGEDK